VSALRCYDRNPRKISAERLEALKRSLEEDRDMLRARPLIALPDGRVVCGNQRLRAAQELGWAAIPTVFVDLDDARARLWVLRDNNSYGEWGDTLPAFLAELATEGVELELTGFSPQDLDRLIREATRVPRDPDETPPAPATPKSRPGELYELGPHRLVCGDSRDPNTLAKLMGDEQAAAIWSDPPYGVRYVGRTRDRLTIENDEPEGLAELLKAVFAAVGSHVEPGGAFYLAAPAGPLGTVFRQQLDQAGWRFHESLVWVKDVFVLGHSDYHYRHEDVLYGHLPGDGRPGRGRHQGSRWRGDNSQDSVFEVDRPKRSEDHPCMKPVGLIAAQLRNSLRPGEVVLDPFAGSGSTLIAADTLASRAFLGELDPAYADVIRQRYADYSGQPEYAP